MAATTTTGRKRALQRRRIIERPRLIALLDESTTRVRTLVAPAGYGKTTLAEQWVGKKGRRGAWFTARPSSTDVAALALGLAHAAREIIPDCDARLREHLRALPAPAENVEVVAELLGEDLETWPPDAWLVLDDYQEIAATDDAERLVEALVAASPIQLLIASRQRPSWITARRILYGEVLELNQTELAMDGHEASEMLMDRNAASASGLVALANGWPAVIGLASVSTAQIDQPDAVPEALYRFFAEEVFSALESDVQVGLATLAIAPIIDRNLATKLLGEDTERVCAIALDIGILVERGVRLEIHPLARAFLEGRLEHSGTAPDADTIQTCLDHFRERRDWDAAFDLLVRHGDNSQLEPLLGEALDELLETARLSTIESWCDQVERIASDTTVSTLARAEVALRRGRLAVAQAHAESLASRTSAFQFQALSIAGRAAHLASREEEALGLFRRAEETAPTQALRREALWNQLSCLIDLEMPEAVAALDQLVSIGLNAPREAVRAAGLRLYCQSRFGGMELTDADRAFHALGAVGDPIVESSFLSVYSSALAMSARYEDARRAADALLAVAERYRLEFAVPYALCSAGIAEAGLRNWDEAEQRLTEGIALSRAASNSHGEQACVAAYIRTLAQRGRCESALALAHDHSLRPSAPILLQMRTELVATRALVLAALGRVTEALATVEPIRGLSRSIEVTVLVAAVDAIVSLKRHDRDAIGRANELSATAFSSGGLDLLVTAYRSTPELLAVLLHASSESDRLHELLRFVGDHDLAHAVGRPLAHENDATSLLTAREREVYDLLRQGLTNREIAQLLFITEATAKLHVQHIFDKLGVRSRKAIAMKAALERLAQATSAIDDTGVGTDS